MYLEALQRALPEAGIEPVCVANADRRPPAGGGLGSVRNAAIDGWWSAVELPRRARSAGAQVIHHPLPARSLRFAGGQVVTVHDLAFELMPEAFAPGYRRFARVAHRRAAAQADAVIAVSHATAADLQRLWGIEPERIFVAHHGPGQALPPATGAAGPRHFLYVGDDEPRKDLPTLLAAYASYRAGAASEPLDLVLAGRRLTAPRTPGVRTELGVSPARLSELYAAAAALVHPARHEGFGLSVLEALASGTPVLAAEIPAVREVCGDAARYFAPGDHATLARALSELAAAPPEPGSPLRAGPERAARFSWAQSARVHAEAYSLAAEMASRKHPNRRDR